MTQRGIVTKTDGTQITVAVARTSMCGENCASCKGGCAPTEQTVIAVNETNEVLSVGDTVLLETETRAVLGNAAVVYLVPLAGLFLAYFVASAYMQNELFCALLSVLTAFLALCFVRIWDRKVQKKNTFLVRITERLRKTGE